MSSSVKVPPLVALDLAHMQTICPSILKPRGFDP